MDQPRRVSRAVDKHAINETTSMHRLYRTVCHVRAVISAKKRPSWPYIYYLMLHDLSVAFPSFHVRFSADGPSLPMPSITLIAQHRPCRVGSVGVGLVHEHWRCGPPPRLPHQHLHVIRLGVAAFHLSRTSLVTIHETCNASCAVAEAELPCNLTCVAQPLS